MKKTQWIYFFQRIRRSKISFVAILVFIMFGVGLYTGLKWYEPALYQSMDADYNTQKFRDLELVFSSGLTEDGLEELQSVPEVSEIEGTYTAYQYFRYNGQKYQAKIKTVTDEIDLLRVKEGALPFAENEIAVDAYWAENNHLSVGDRIVLEHDGDGSAHLLRELLDGEMPDPAFRNDDGMQYFKCDTFTVTALVYSPAELSMIASKYEPSPVNPAPISAFFFAPRTAFDEDAFPGYTGALVRSDTLRGMATTDEAYAAAVAAFADTLRPVAERLCEDQTKRIHNAFEALRAFPSGVDASALTVPESSVVLLTRTSNPTVVLTDVIGEFGEKLCTNFGSVFLIIGILICYSTLSRLVYQETVLSGTKKGAGLFRPGDHPLVYAQCNSAGGIRRSRRGAAIDACRAAGTFEQNQRVLFLHGVPNHICLERHCHTVCAGNGGAARFRFPCLPHYPAPKHAVPAHRRGAALRASTSH